MGQKVNPVGMRVGVNRDWNSRWFANDKDYNKFLNQDIKIRKYLEKECQAASLSHIEIERIKTDKGYNVSVLIFVARVALVVGEQGKNVNRAASEPVSKTIRSAAANAINNFGMDENSLYVAEIYANDGMRIKRFIPRAKGSASGLVKRCCHITVVVKMR